MRTRTIHPVQRERKNRATEEEKEIKTHDVQNFCTPVATATAAAAAAAAAMVAAAAAALIEIRDAGHVSKVRDKD
jgi:hypothetical protein